MSLLVFNGSSRVAHGVLRNLYKSGNFEKIVAADIYPNYHGIQNFLSFKESIANESSSTQLTDIKISEKSDLYNAMSKASHVVYITHDYYSNCSSKLNLIKTTAKLAKEQGHLKKLVTVTPVELDHQGEVDAQNAAIVSENEAMQEYPDIVQIKTDLTFGPDSTVVRKLLNRIAHNKNIYFKPSHSAPSPIHTDNVAQAVAQLLQDGTTGKKFLAQGNTKVEWHHLLGVLEKALGRGYAAQENKCMIENTIPPTSTNAVSEMIYMDCYMNLTQFIKNYQQPSSVGAEDLTSLGIEPVDFETFYAEGSLNAEEYKCGRGVSNSCIPCFLY